MAMSDGEKTRIIGWLLALVQTVFLAVLGWAGGNIVQAKQDIAVLQANYQNINSVLQEIKFDVKALRNRKDKWKY